MNRNRLISLLLTFLLIGLSCTAGPLAWKWAMYERHESARIVEYEDLETVFYEREVAPRWARLATRSLTMVGFRNSPAEEAFVHVWTEDDSVWTQFRADGSVRSQRYEPTAVVVTSPPWPHLLPYKSAAEVLSLVGEAHSRVENAAALGYVELPDWWEHTK